MPDKKEGQNAKKKPTRPVMEGRVIPPGGFPGQDEMEIEKRLEIFTVEKPFRRLSDLVVPPETLQQIGDRFGITKERIRQLEARLLKRLREALRARLSDVAPGLPPGESSEEDPTGKV